MKIGGKNLGKFNFIETEVPGIVIIEPQVFGDHRGYFMETFHKEEFAAAGITLEFVQDNQSMSRKGVLRGLHFQKEKSQGKLVRVISGSVYDVGVDLRPNSPHFGKWVGVELSAENKKMLYVPPGFGHGFLVLTETAEFTYKCTDLYAPEAEGGVRWDDPAIGIQWPNVGIEPMLSEKDLQLKGIYEQDFTYFERWHTLNG